MLWEGRERGLDRREGEKEGERVEGERGAGVGGQP